MPIIYEWQLRDKNAIVCVILVKPWTIFMSSGPSRKMFSEIVRSLPNCTQRIRETRKNNHCAASMASLKCVFYALRTELPSENFTPGWSEGNNFFFRKVKWNASEFSYVNSFHWRKRNMYQWIFNAISHLIISKLVWQIL